MSADPRPTAATVAAQRYYDSTDADEFYFNVWGGEDIHIGLYTPGTSIAEASSRTVDAMIEVVGTMDTGTHVLDLGAGYGGAARRLATQFGCAVTCLNLSETQNARNRAACAERGFDRIEVVQGNFESLPFDEATYDVAWSQDAFLHSGAREQVLAEVARVLRPGGRLVFTDPMRHPDAPASVLAPILQRIHLSDLASFDFYRDAAARVGLEVETVRDFSPELANHYEAVRCDLEARRDEIERLASPAYVSGMLAGLDLWVRAGREGHLAWGIMLMRKPRA